MCYKNKKGEKEKRQ